MLSGLRSHVLHRCHLSAAAGHPLVQKKLSELLCKRRSSAGKFIFNFIKT